MEAKTILVTALAFIVASALAQVPEDFEDIQTEFYLPYSVTEDVDFTLQRPAGFGCYQW